MAAPDATVVFDNPGGEKIFNHPDYKKQAQYSLLDNLDYENEKTNLCIGIIPSVDLKPGLYVAELYTDTYKPGMTTFSLK